MSSPTNASTDSRVHFSRAGNHRPRPVLLLVVSVCLLAPPAQAKYGGGSGTADDPYLICTPDDMNAIGADPNDWGKCFKLTADINLAAYTGESFNMIGYYVEWDDRKPFTGVFDGNGHTISGFTYTSTARNCIALFGLVGDVYGGPGVVKNLGLIDPNINAGSGYDAAALVGILGGVVSDCYVQGGNVSGGDGFYKGVGGLVGDNHGVVRDCYATCNVVGTDALAGGLVGANNGTVSDCYTAGTVSGRTGVGGLVGCNGGSDWNGTVSNCYADSNVSGYSSTGGLVGKNGGFDLNGNIADSYSTGAVSGTLNVGGLVGRGGTATACFWDVNTSGQLTSAGGTGKTTTEMYDPNTYLNAGWDFVGETQNGPGDDWAEPNEPDYPLLWWQVPPSELHPLPTFSDGTGEPDNPYLISNAQELNSIGHNPRLMEAHFKLANNIDLTGVNFFIMGNLTYPYAGVFDGQGNEVSNFNYHATEGEYLGLFGVVRGANAIVKDIGVKDPNVSSEGRTETGALVGHLIDGTLDSCYVQDGNVAGDEYIGGLVGGNSGTIVNCVSSCTVSGDGYHGGGTGGLVGHNSGSILDCDTAGVISGRDDVGGLAGWNEGTASNCRSSATVSGHMFVGGLVGASREGGVISECYSQADVTASSSYIGGLIGRNDGIVLGCACSSNVSGASRVGGLVGLNDAVISDSYSIGSVSGTSDFVGGLVGTNYEVISNCYSTGNPSGADYVGGLVGRNSGGTVDDSFWDVNTSGVAGSAGGTGKTTSDMQDPNTFLDADWDFVGEDDNGTDDIWAMCGAVTYPKLLWQFVVGDFDGDYDVDFGDFCFLAARWLQTDTSFYCPAGGTDLTNDGSTDSGDLRLFVNNWLTRPQ